MDALARQRLTDGAACLEAALYYLSLGWSPLALCPPDHVGIRLVNQNHSKSCKSPGKVPWWAWKEWQDHRPTEQDLRYWWQRLANSNVGIALGPVSGLIRIDVDGEGGEAALQAKAQGDLPATLEFRSGRRDGTGRGLLYKIPQGVTLRTTPEAHGVKQELRFQARGAQTVLPPSRHPDGKCYAWVEGYDPHEMEAALAPKWLVKELSISGSTAQGRTHRSTEEWKKLIGGVDEGQRNDSLAALAGKLFYMMRDLSDSSAIAAVYELLAVWNEHNDAPLDDAELQTTTFSIHRKETIRRTKEDADFLDNFVKNGIDQATNNGDRTMNEPPDWHLIIIESEPAEYMLRSPYWLDSPKLENGYIHLAALEILEWSKLRKQAFVQADVSIPKSYRGWDAPGGPLARLVEHAERRAAHVEMRRDLYVLGFIYRYLKTARPVKTSEDGTTPRWPDNGRPTIRHDNKAYIFKFQHMKSEVQRIHENFVQKELTKALRANGGKTIIVENSRWWCFTENEVEEIGRKVGETTPLAFESLVQPSLNGNGKHEEEHAPTD